jgi:hypothetical protein
MELVKRLQNPSAVNAFKVLAEANKLKSTRKSNSQKGV